MRLTNLLVDLAGPRFEPQRVHHELEALDRAGVYPLREHRTPERYLGWIDATFGGTWSTEAALGGAWIALADDRPVGFAAYDARGLRFHWLDAWKHDPSVGLFGPMGVDVVARRRGIGGALARAALFSLRERGYRHALVPAVGPPEIVSFYEHEADARVVETFDAGRDGRRWRATVLASGNGSNFQAVLDAARGGELPLDVTALLSNREGAFALERAARGGVAAQAVPWQRGVQTREAYDAALIGSVAATAPDVVLLLGWMHVLPVAFLERFPQTINIHPAFLPLDLDADAATAPDGTSLVAYRGARAFDDALAAGSAWAGASVHRVSVAIDRGPILARAPLALDTAPREVLEERLHALEHRVLLDAIRRWAWEQP